MKPVKLKVTDTNGSVEMNAGSFFVSFSRRSPAINKTEKFIVGDDWELTLKKVPKKK
jgi:hypothetical protein